MSDLKVTALKRVFVYGALQLDDPDTGMKPEEVKEFWSDVYPELTQAVVEGPDYKEDAVEYTFRKAVGTKGVETVTEIDRTIARVLTGVFAKEGAEEQAGTKTEYKAASMADDIKVMKILARIIAREEAETNAKAVIFPPGTSLGLA